MGNVENHASFSTQVMKYQSQTPKDIIHQWQTNPHVADFCHVHRNCRSLYPSRNHRTGNYNWIMASLC